MDVALSTKIDRIAAKLMDDYRLPDIAYSSLIVNDEVFAILADLDQLQANLAGSEVWPAQRVLPGWIGFRMMQGR